MALRISQNNTTATVSRTKLRVGVAAVEPVAGVAFVLAAADIAYVDLTLSVMVDVNGFYKLFGHEVAVDDAAEFEFTKAAANTVSASEASSYSFSTGRADTATASDLFSRVVDYNRAFVDTVDESETQVFSVGKPLSDAFTTSHFEVFDHQKLLVDGVAMNDGMEAVDGFGIALTRGVSNVALVGDAKALSFTGSRVESISTQDAGSLRSQGYCDFSYFAEDYVGASLAF